MNYQEALDFIHGTKKFATKPGLTRIENLLQEMGNPHKCMKYVHIAGTNGKGSSTAMMASILMKAGYKTGMFISPYLERFNERMQINGVPISDEDLCFYTEKTKNHIDQMLEKGMVHPTEFELLTAMAFDYWADQGCEFVSLEVGMGGRLDSTNIIDAPEVAMILSISFDHMHYLGNTLEEIAWEKGGIIKPGSDVVCYADQPQEALETIERICIEREVPLAVPNKQDIEIVDKGLFGTTFRYCGIETTVPLMGMHQVYNAVGVIEAARALTRRGYPITDEMIVSGITDTKWVGRLEPVSQKPYCVIDAAHNPDAVRVLSKTIDDLFAGRRIIAVMGILADKDYAYCIPEVAKRSVTFVATTPSSGRALSAEETAKIASQHCTEVFTEPTIEKAIDKAFALAGDDAMVLVCGSLYVIGEAKTYIKGR